MILSPDVRHYVEVETASNMYLQYFHIKDGYGEMIRRMAIERTHNRGKNAGERTEGDKVLLFQFSRDITLTFFYII